MKYCNHPTILSRLPSTSISPSSGGQMTQFHLHYAEQGCVEPDGQLVVVRGCTGGWWEWEGHTGMMVWREREGEVGMCFTSIKYNEKIVMKPCEELNENQYVEFGDFIEEGGSTELLPFCLDCWRARQDRLREKELVEHRKVVTEALKDISDREVASLGVAPVGERRAVVFYADNRQAVRYLQWWIRAWRFIGLDDAREAFDIVVMVEPDTVPDLPSDCHEYTMTYSAQSAGPGRCIFKQYRGRLAVWQLITTGSINLLCRDC